MRPDSSADRLIDLFILNRKCMVRKRGRHDTSREIHKFGHILVVNMCVASVPYSKMSLKERDIPGTILLIYIVDIISNIYL